MPTNEVAPLRSPRIITHNDMRSKYALLATDADGMVVLIKYFDNEQEAVNRFNNKADYGIRSDAIFLMKIVLFKPSEKTMPIHQLAIVPVEKQ